MTILLVIEFGGPGVPGGLEGGTICKKLGPTPRAPPMTGSYDRFCDFALFPNFQKVTKFRSPRQGLSIPGWSRHDDNVFVGHSHLCQYGARPRPLHWVIARRPNVQESSFSLHSISRGVKSSKNMTQKGELVGIEHEAHCLPIGHCALLFLKFVFYRVHGGTDVESLWTENLKNIGFGGKKNFRSIFVKNRLHIRNQRKILTLEDGF